MSECLYDNPDTMRRELYLDRKLIACISSLIVVQRGVYPEHFKKPKWSNGTWYGSYEALPEDIQQAIEDNPEVM